MNYPSLTVILPTYNEAENIVPLIREIQKYVPASCAILVVDDDSPDGTAQRVQRFITTHKAKTHVNLLVRRANRGLTNSLKAAIAIAKGSIALWMDCDFSHPPAVIPQLLHAIKKGADIAVASRFLKTPVHRAPAEFTSTDSVLQSALTRCLNAMISRCFGAGVTDYTTGFVAVRRAVLKRIPLRGDYGEYCIDFLLRAKIAGYRIAEIPYTSPPRTRGASKTAPNLATTIRHGYGYLATIAALFWKIKIRQALP